MTKRIEAGEFVGATLGVAVVNGVAGVSIDLETGLGSMHARRAASCLLDPMRHDRVLYAGLGDGGIFVLAVLERGDHERADTMTFDRGLEVRVPGGGCE